MAEHPDRVSLNDKVDAAIALLKRAADEYAPTTFANSFGAEDMVLTDLICKHVPAIEIFSLDTGRLPQETYDLMQKAKQRYAAEFKVYFPIAEHVEEYTQQNGPNAFYESIELRKSCCNIRKVEPLRRALAGKQAWITGLRREQAPTRTDLSHMEWDTAHAMHKLNPLIDWTNEEVWEYIRQHKIPYNALHDRGYPSIGCAPCTRAVQPGEDQRAGRWWWENPETKECGLHVSKERKVS